MKEVPSVNENNKHITRDLWAEASSFDRIARPGDTVDDEIAMHFLNCVPPVVHRYDYFQSSEPYSHEPVGSGEILAPTYPTFAKKSGVWVYLGNCFLNKDTDIPVTHPYC